MKTMNMQDLHQYLSKYGYTRDGEIYVSVGSKGYWSNIDRDDNKKLISQLQNRSAKEVIQNNNPELYDVIFSPRREAGLELLELSGDETVIDIGCMWGALTVPLSKRARHVIGVEQTRESLELLRARLRDEDITNVTLINQDAKSFPALPDHLKADVIIVNGVLEWLPEVDQVELKRYIGKRNVGHEENLSSPGDMQKEFLKLVFSNLKVGGRLYLAIENRYDYKMFLGLADPHNGLLFTTLLPRGLANLVSQLRLGRPYRNWIYSRTELEKILKETGFPSVSTYVAYPDYRFPEYIENYEGRSTEFRPSKPIPAKTVVKKIKRRFQYFFEYLIFKFMNLRFFFPSFITISKK